MYKRSIEDPSGFWSDIASKFYWKEKWGKEVCHENLDVREGTVKIEVCVLFWLLFERFLFLDCGFLTANCFC